ncbi:MAG: hypothetical protein ACXVYM_03460 [Gaiellaceae bacterium]
MAPLLADAAHEGLKVVSAMLIVGLILVAPALIGEGYRFLRYYRRGRVPRH